MLSSPEMFRHLLILVECPEILKNLTSLLSRFTCQSQKTQCYSKSDQSDPEGVLPNKEVEVRGGGGGGLDLTLSLEAKFGARSGQVHKITRKTCEVLSPQDAKVGKKS